MAKSKSSAAVATPKEDNAVVRYLKETRAELRKVAWPTRDETKNLTIIVVSVTFAMAVFLGLLDYIFQIVTAGVIAGDYLWIGVAVVLLAAGAAAFYVNSQQE
ncbi:MAG: preprotein translocase subunit SecE [Anaerolineales bacterium]|nr:preprotein translocase subunit SecE [Anaerolineales bacterium]